MPRGRRQLGPEKVLPYKTDFRPTIVKELTLRCGISQGELAEVGGVSRPAINLWINHGYMPQKQGFAAKVGHWLTHGPKSATVNAWLKERGYKIAQMFGAIEASETFRDVKPSDMGARCSEREMEKRYNPAIRPGDPDKNDCLEVVEMLNQKAMKHFKLFRSPFMNDITKAQDIYKDEDHRYIEAAMLDAARHSGFLAVVGEVGSGKTTIRKLAMEQLRREGDIQIVYPEILDKDRITSSSLCDAIIMDISNDTPRVRHEQKARQVKQLLQDRSKSGVRCCLMIEEAHRLSISAFKTIKQLQEMEDASGYRKLLSVVLIGQIELGDKLDERYHPEMREVIRRCQVARIDGLTDIVAYLEWKFKLVNVRLDTVFDDEALVLLQKRLTTSGELGRSISVAYPLTVNLYTIRAMNLAAELGESRVTADVIEAI